ncbi:MAG: SpoIIE family protein phosphatase, partial [Planctomycetota bacterium]|nr:SpoIIE family protein phosphatase [Planctomycetota bacterium]
MATLTDYLDTEILQQVQDNFTALTRVPIRICHPDGWPLTNESEPGSDAQADEQDKPCDVPIEIGPQVVGYIRLSPDSAARRETGPPAAGGRLSGDAMRFVRLMAGVIARMYDREKQLRTRVEELATLYRLTAGFTDQHDLQNVLDMVAQTVTDVLDAMACSIRMLSDDGNELLIKAVANLSPEYLEKGPILVADSSIDRQVLETGEVVYIADEQSDPRVLYKTEARQEGIVSALCAPLMYKGRPEGVIHVYTAEPHEFDWFEVSLLRVICAQAAAAIVNARLYTEAVKAATMRRELNLAGEVQRRMIPAEPPKYPSLDIATIYVPCFQLGGDFYDFLELPPDNLGLAVCDVVGKGVRASLLMASIRASLRAHAANVYDMSHVLAKVNRDLCDDTLLGDFATLFYGVIEVNTLRFTYANAGHMPPLLFRGGKVCHLTTGGGVLGIDLESHWRHEVMTFNKGDVLLAFTDGLVEAMNFHDEQFGRQRIEAAALTAIGQDCSAEAIAKHVLWEMRRFAGLQKRLDDIT